MERKVVDCDRCQTPESVRPEGRLQVPVHRGLDAAGSNETDYQRVDLCPSCLAAELKEFIKPLGYDEGKEWTKKVLSWGTNRPLPGRRGQIPLTQ